MAEDPLILSDGTTRLRPATMTEMWPVFGWRNRPHVRTNMYTSQPIEPWEHQAWFRSVLDDPEREIWVISSDGRDIGTVVLSEIDPRAGSCSWAFYIGENDLTGRGIGSAVERLVLAHVFDTLGLEVLRCEVLEFNLPVIGLHRKFGFRETGRIENRVMRDGQPVAAVCLELDRKTWRETWLGNAPRTAGHTS